MSHLNVFIHSLREELKQFGEMLALLDQQQDAVVTCQANTVLETVEALHAQSEVIKSSRQEREQCQRALAKDLGQSEDIEVSTLIAVCPADYRPLLGALVQENHELLLRVHQRAKQNQLLLNRSLLTMQALIGSLCAATAPQVYTGTGNIFPARTSGRVLCEAVA
jgi:flagellar biosynthesis/type III secretory pathway chaperone